MLESEWCFVQPLMTRALHATVTRSIQTDRFLGPRIGSVPFQKEIKLFRRAMSFDSNRE
jgi:hypothetical protein